MHTNEIKHLIEKYNNQTATPAEKKLVEQWYESIDGKESADDNTDKERFRNEIFENITARIQGSKEVIEPGRLKIRYTWFFRAAILLMIFSAGAYLYLKRPAAVYTNSVAKTKKKEIVPGGNNAVLMLADGSKVLLNEASDGQVASQSGVKITKTKSGELTYSFAGSKSANTAAVNTVITPRGGQYHLILVDGTEVWLNASSSIRFPTVFTGNEREVDITGEVYFEVAKNRVKPFIVNTDQSEIRVLGTHFNVNTYNDEEYQRITLLEGSVEIKKNNQKARLKPGQQANLSYKSTVIRVEDIDDLEAIIAWKNGYFQFERADLQSVMRQISRWYDTDVSYNGQIPRKEYSGKMPRNASVKKLIEMLSYTGIHCKVERNQIIVNP